VFERSYVVAFCIMKYDDECKFFISLLLRLQHRGLGAKDIERLAESEEMKEVIKRLEATTTAYSSKSLYAFRALLNPAVKVEDDTSEVSDEQVRLDKQAALLRLQHIKTKLERPLRFLYVGCAVAVFLLEHQGAHKGADGRLRETSVIERYVVKSCPNFVLWSVCVCTVEITSPHSNRAGFNSYQSGQSGNPRPKTCN
jgi:hypothetical protein